VNVVVVSFGGYWAFWPSFWGNLFRKKVFIILHGTDCAAIPEINYGSLRIPILKWICGKSYDFANVLLPVSESLVKCKLNFDQEIHHVKQGFFYHFPKLTSSYRIIHNGLDENFWTFPSPEVKTENSFLTVLSQSQFELKGGDLILEVAAEFPDCSFYFAGCTDSHLKSTYPKNIIFLGRLSPEALRDYYRKTRFYFQLSTFEGFGCALAEAMLCGCIPIGSSVNHIPQIIGSSGLIVSAKNREELSGKIKEALDLKNKDELALAARNQIIKNFSLEKRKADLLGFIKNYKG
jgi:glycosyltransferase involved in cell wall biosynthesis